MMIEIFFVERFLSEIGGFQLTIEYCLLTIIRIVAGEMIPHAKAPRRENSQFRQDLQDFKWSSHRGTENTEKNSSRKVVKTQNDNPQIAPIDADYF
jgi:hypothetical protein